MVTWEPETSDEQWAIEAVKPHIWCMNPNCAFCEGEDGKRAVEILRRGQQIRKERFLAEQQAQIDAVRDAHAVGMPLISQPY